MRMSRNLRAVSSLILIILMLLSAVVGGFISYLWVMSNYYNMPENSTLLIVENVVFPIFNATYFNVTVLNPSNSVLNVNVTVIQVTVEGTTGAINVTTAEPQFPFLMRKGTRQIFMCLSNWSPLAGDTVRIEPVSAGVSTKSYAVTVPYVKLSITPNFDASTSITHFSVTVQNLIGSLINVNISQILLFGQELNANVTPSLPFPLASGGAQVFQCDWNWEDLRTENVTITVETLQGYEANYTAATLPGAVLSISDVEFPKTDSRFFNVTVTNAAQATASAIISQVNLTLQGGAPFSVKARAPYLLNTTFSEVFTNSSKTFECDWNWTDQRNENVTVNVYTSQGYKISSETVETPDTTVWNITDVKFDLDDTSRFSVNVTNMPVSLYSVTVTKILFNQTATSLTASPVIIDAGQQTMINCTFGWHAYRGENVTITVFTEDGKNISRFMTVPSVKVEILGNRAAFSDFRDRPSNVTIPVPILYVNVTISNSNNSLSNVTITRIVFESGNQTYEIDGNITDPAFSPTAYILAIGKTVTVICPWNWVRYMGTDLEVTVYTKEGITASKTWNIFDA
jgi:hypothetical protein